MGRHLSLPLFAIRSQSSIDLHHHSKLKKLVPSPIANSRFHRCLILFSIFSLFIGLAGVIFAFTAFRSSPQISLFPCTLPHDTLVTLKSLTNSAGWISGDRGFADRPKLLGFVGVQTSFSFASRRSALRSTWFPSHPDALLRLEQSTGLAFRFVIGRSKDRENMEALAKEVDEHKDFMLIDVDEDSTQLPYKTLEFFKAAIHLFNADYYVKTDDNIYMRPDRLATLLAKERTHPLTYIGCMKKGPVVKDPKIKWYERSGNLLGSDYFLHAYGPLYVLSADVVASLAAAKNHSLRMFSNEDVSVGSWMLGMNVNHEDTRTVCDSRCTPTSIAVWDIPKCSGLCDPVSRVKELHGIQMCSQSPTLPPDDK